MTDPLPPKTSRRTIWIALLFLVIAAVAALLLLRGEDQAAPPPAPEALRVTVLKVVPRDVPLTGNFIGKTRSASKVEIRARVDGFLEKRLYEEGSKVEKGQVLFQMDQKPFIAALESSRAAQQAQEAALQYAKVNLDRVESMVGNNVTAKKDLDVAVSSYKSSLASLEMAKAQVRQDELELSYTTISSPISGLTSFAQQEVGAYINNTDKSLLTYVAQLDPMRVEFSVSENMLLKARDDAQRGFFKEVTGKSIVEIVLIDGTVYPYRGELTFADASLSETTGTFLIRATIPNPKEELRPGQFVRIRLLGAIRPNAILLPQSAVLQGPAGSFVWLVDEATGKVSARPVTPGDWYENTQWFIDEGLRGNETVVVAGAGKLSPGDSVIIDRFEPLPSAAQADAASEAGPAAGQKKEAP